MCEYFGIRCSTGSSKLGARCSVCAPVRIILARVVPAIEPVSTKRDCPTALAKRACSCTHRSSEPGSIGRSCPHGTAFTNGCTNRSKWAMLMPSDAAASALVRSRRGTASIGRSRDRLGMPEASRINQPHNPKLQAPHHEELLDTTRRGARLPLSQRDPRNRLHRREGRAVRDRSRSTPSPLRSSELLADLDAHNAPLGFKSPPELPSRYRVSGPESRFVQQVPEWLRPLVGDC